MKGKTEKNSKQYLSIGEIRNGYVHISQMEMIFAERKRQSSVISEKDIKLTRQNITARELVQMREELSKKDALLIFKKHGLLSALIIPNYNDDISIECVIGTHLCSNCQRCKATKSFAEGGCPKVYIRSISFLMRNSIPISEAILHGNRIERFPFIENGVELYVKSKYNSGKLLIFECEKFMMDSM